MTDDLSVVWIVESGRSGARHQAHTVAEHMDVTLLHAAPIDVPSDTSWEESVKEGDEHTYPIKDLAEAVRALDPDVAVFHVFSQDTFEAAPEVSAFCTTVLRVGYNPMEGAISVTGMNQSTLQWYSSFDHLVCASEAASRKMWAAGVPGYLTSVIPTAVDFSPEAVKKPERDTPHTLGFLGRIAPAKNPELLPFVVYALREIEPTLRPTIRYAGSGTEQMMESLTGVASRLAIGQREVIFDGYVEDVPAWFEGIGVNLHPSLTENLPQSVLEAAQQGVPTVATEAGWTQEWDSIITCPGDDPWAWAETLAELLTNEARRYRVAKEQQEEAAAKADIASARTAYQSLFRSLVDRYDPFKIDPAIKARGNL